MTVGSRRAAASWGWTGLWWREVGTNPQHLHRLRTAGGLAFVGHLPLTLCGFSIEEDLPVCLFTKVISGTILAGQT